MCECESALVHTMCVLSFTLEYNFMKIINICYSVRPMKQAQNVHGVGIQPRHWKASKGFSEEMIILFVTTEKGG